MRIYCCQCEKEIDARKTNGEEIYPHRKDLFSLKFWKCDECSNFVGCHKSAPDNQPLGVIPTEEVRKARRILHSVIDPLWRSKKIRRGRLYQIMAMEMKYPKRKAFHVGDLKTIEECRRAYRAATDIKHKLKDYEKT